tara:strand:- start:2392 stop:2679 length:288 start_codon:yes stop_codon:yes gene_type:complete
MNQEYQLEDWIYENFYKAVIRAITRSPEVRGIMEKIESRGLTRNMAAINLIICMDELAKLTHETQTEINSSKNQDTLDTSYFDEARWMKQARIKL